MHTPRITVGLVVHNGESHLAAAIQSFLDQTFRDFELVIYDNASTDATPQIAEMFAAIDDRIRIVHHATNIGALRNWNYAVDHCDTPLFCWAAHDDLREPIFLQSLIEALDQYPEAMMACCDARVIDPDGSSHHTLPDTHRFRTTAGLSAERRLRMYLSGAPASPIFGLYRTPQLREAIQVFREAAERGGPLLLWLDIVFLIGLFNRHHVAVVHEPLFLFRRGGVSHRIDLYRTMREFFNALREFRRLLMSAAADTHRSIPNRIRIRVALWRYYLRTITSPPVRRMFWHHLSRDVPMLRQLQARWMVMRDPAFRRLRRRMKMLPRGSRVMIFGAGKHTRRCIAALQRAIEPHSYIIGICDDSAPRCKSIAPYDILSPERSASMRPDVVLVSSDTYEQAMCRRARDIAPPQSKVWCIYDLALEATHIDRSSASIEVKNDAISSITSAAA